MIILFRLRQNIEVLRIIGCATSQSTPLKKLPINNDLQNIDTSKLEELIKRMDESNFEALGMLGRKLAEEIIIELSNILSMVPIDLLRENAEIEDAETFAKKLGVKFPGKTVNDWMAAFTLPTKATAA